MIKVVNKSSAINMYDTYCIIHIFQALAKFTNQSCMSTSTKTCFITFMGTTACVHTVLEISPCFK